MKETQRLIFEHLKMLVPNLNLTKSYGDSVIANDAIVSVLDLTGTTKRSAFDPLYSESGLTTFIDTTFQFQISTYNLDISPIQELQAKLEYFGDVDDNIYLSSVGDVLPMPYNEGSRIKEQYKLSIIYCALVETSMGMDFIETATMEIKQ